MIDIKLPDSRQTEEFRELLHPLAERVMEEYQSSPELLNLKGINPLIALENAQIYLGKTLLTVFEYRNIELHIRMLPWVYRSYKRHGFSDDYFKTTLKLWIKAVNSFMPEPEVYTEFLNYLLKCDEQMQELAGEIPETYLKSSAEAHYSEKELRELMTALLTNDKARAELLLKDYFLRGEDAFIEEAIMPVMYETGRLWELDKITVADEHRISAIVSGFIASMHVEKFTKPEKSILITPAPNEFHEIGALLLADTFRKKNWAVTYLNAGTPVENILDSIENKAPDIIAISTALILHASNLRYIVKSIKEKYPQIPIIAGGKFINDNPEIIDQIDADGAAHNLRGAFELAERLTG